MGKHCQFFCTPTGHKILILFNPNVKVNYLDSSSIFKFYYTTFTFLCQLCVAVI